MGNRILQGLVIVAAMLFVACGPITAEKTHNEVFTAIGNSVDPVITTPIIINFTNAAGDQPRIIAAGYAITVNSGGAGSIAFGFHDDVTVPCSTVPAIATANFTAGATSTYAAWGIQALTELNNRTSGRYLMCVVITQADLTDQVDIEIAVSITGEFVIIK